MSDFPKRNASFNPNEYRSQAAYDAHLTASRVNNNAPKPGNASNPNGYRGHAAQSAYQNHSRGSNNNNTPKNKQFLQKKHATQKAGTSSNEAVNTDKPHFMTDEEVRQWFREAEADYERDKKAGKYDSYVLAGGHAPDFSAFRKTFDGSKTKIGGRKDSMHAPKKAGASDSEPAKPKGGN